MHTKHARRPWYVALGLQIGIRIVYFFQSWGFTKVFFTRLSGHQTKFRDPNFPEMGLGLEFIIKVLWTISTLAREYFVVALFMILTGLYPILSWVYQKIGAHVCAKMRASGYDFSKTRNMPIPEYDWKNGSAKEFYDTFVRHPHPVILRGFMKGSSLLTAISYDEVLRRFGEEDVFLTTKEMDGTPGKLKLVDTPGYYLHNSEILFNKNPELIDHLQTERLEDYLKMKPGYSQLFCGRAGTGSPFHCAANFNMFYMIDGKKRWYFIDPYFTSMMYPMWGAGKAAAISLCLYPDEYEKKTFPMMEFCPYYSATVEAGDVLFNPPYWWHGIRNISEKSTAIASRWHTDGIAGHKLMMTEEDYDVARFHTFQFFIGINSYSFMHGILQEPSPSFDEHITLREKNNRYVHNQRAGAFEPGIKRLGYRFTF